MPREAALEELVGIRTKTATENFKYVACRITRQHPISHRRMEETGSSRSTSKRGFNSTSIPIQNMTPV